MPPPPSATCSPAAVLTQLPATEELQQGQAAESYILTDPASPRTRLPSPPRSLALTQYILLPGPGMTTGTGTAPRFHGPNPVAL